LLLITEAASYSKYSRVCFFSL